MYTFESRVRYSECDEHGRLSLLSLINYLQDTSTFHSETIGRGVDYMTSRKLGWLISAWQIEIAALPHFLDEIRIDTWCPTMGRTLTNRNFVISGTDGSPLVRADSLWFIYDFVHGRPIRIPEDQQVYLTGEDPLDMPATQRRLPVEGPSVEAPELVVSEQHLDTNRHVNNAQYLGMATGALAAVLGPERAGQTDRIRRICVQYKRQALLGDLIVPHVHVGDEAYTVSLDGSDGDAFAIVRLELGDIA